MEPEEKEAGCLFGRSARAWGEIILFYLAYYTALVAWFYSMMCFFNAIIDPFEPTLQGDTSFLKSPGIGYRPQIDYTTDEIWFDEDSSSEKNKKLIKSFEDVLEPYGDFTDHAYRRSDCSDDNPINDFPCRLKEYNHKDFAPCNKAGHFGLTSGLAKCFLLRLNKIYGWKPADYKLSELNDVDMPDKVRKIIDAANRRPPGEGKVRLIPLWCKGKTEGDSGFLNQDDIDYHPYPGFPYHLYPYKNQWAYLQPFVMVRFNTVTPNKKIFVRCQVWAPNIDVSEEEKTGFTEFSMYFHQPNPG